MKAITTTIPDVLIFEPRVFADERGWFMESFNQKTFDELLGVHQMFVQDNHSFSKAGVLRGLHFQRPPHAQGKLVRVISGCVWDVAVDIRKSSVAFGKWVGIELSADNKRQLWIPPGFAHGFLTLSQTAEFLYKTTSLYHAPSEGAIVWDDPQLDIRWRWSAPRSGNEIMPILVLDVASRCTMGVVVSSCCGGGELTFHCQMSYGR